MTKKHFIALADAIREHNKFEPATAFSEPQLRTLIEFCRRENSAFMATRWLDYIAGECGPNGGKR
jgi:hypothetical protein